MRSFILPVLILLTVSSCSSYQYLTLNSTDVPKNDKHLFSWENDTLRLTYDFHGHKGPMIMTIYNKTDKPLYINWKKSAFIRDGHSSSLFNSNVQVVGSAATYKTRYVNFSSLSGSFDIPEGMDLIPPASDITKALPATAGPQALNTAYFADTAKDATAALFDGLEFKYKKYTFDAGQSPLQFKSYLTFVVGANNPQEFSVTHSFFANEVIRTKQNPEAFDAYHNDGDKLFVRE